MVIAKVFRKSGYAPRFSIKPTVIRDCHGGEFRVALPWELLYADDLAVIAETEEELINEWKDNVDESQYE